MAGWCILFWKFHLLPLKLCAFSNVEYCFMFSCSLSLKHACVCVHACTQFRYDTCWWEVSAPYLLNRGIEHFQRAYALKCETSALLLCWRSILVGIIRKLLLISWCRFSWGYWMLLSEKGKSYLQCVSDPKSSSNCGEKLYTSLRRCLCKYPYNDWTRLTPVSIFFWTAYPLF